MHPAIPIALVFIGCCSNVIFLELLVQDYPGSGNIITFFQFLFIAFEGFVFTTNFGRKQPAIPLRNYVTMVAMFFVVQVVNNYALNFNISIPLHTIFRAGSLIANLILGVIILKRRYNLSKYFSVVMISVGIAVCTVVSANSVSKHHVSLLFRKLVWPFIQSTKMEEGATDDKIFNEVVRWLIGVSMLTFALFMSARMGIFQEQMYSKFGKHPKEALFYNHALPLPGFIFLSSDIYQHILYFNQSAPMDIPLLGLAVPKMWVYLIGNVLTQYVCIRAVFILTTECQSLTVTLVVTLRKFLSLIFSIIYFKNPFTFYHWIGTTLVFMGTLIFTDTFSVLKSLITTKKEKSQ